MNQAEKMRLLETLAILANVCGRNMSDQALIFYFNALKDLDCDKCCGAATKLAESGRFPSVEEIKKKVIPEINEKDDAREIASLIITSISKFGSYRQLDAKEWVGDLAWRVVERSGGWQMLCESVTGENIGIFTAQLRDLAESTIRRDKAGKIDERPALSGAVDGVYLIEKAREEQNKAREIK